MYDDFFEYTMISKVILNSRLKTAIQKLTSLGYDIYGFIRPYELSSNLSYVCIKICIP